MNFVVEYGTETIKIPKKSDDYTHEWTVYIKVIKPKAISTNRKEGNLIKSVDFKLPNSFTESLRTVLSPPYEVNDECWGEFDIDIKIYLQHKKKPITLKIPIELTKRKEPHIVSKTITIAIPLSNIPTDVWQQQLSKTAPGVVKFLRETQNDVTFKAVRRLLSEKLAYHIKENPEMIEHLQNDLQKKFGIGEGTAETSGGGSGKRKAEDKQSLSKHFKLNSDDEKKKTGGHFSPSRLNKWANEISSLEDYKLLQIYKIVKNTSNFTFTTDFRFDLMDMDFNTLKAIEEVIDE